MSESSDIRQPSLDSDNTVPNFGQIGRCGRISGYLAEVLAGSGRSSRISGQSGRDPPRTAGSSIGRDPAVLCRILAKIAGIRHKWPDSGHYAGICMSNIKKYLYIILIKNLIFFKLI
jgi:hypothetical protein